MSRPYTVAIHRCHLSDWALVNELDDVVRCVFPSLPDAQIEVDILKISLVIDLTRIGVSVKSGSLTLRSDGLLFEGWSFVRVVTP